MTIKNKPSIPTIRFPMFSDEWIEKPLNSLSNIYQSKTISKNLFTQGGYPVYGANGQIGYFSAFNHDKEQIAITCRGATCGTLNFTQKHSWITGNAMVVNSDEYSDSIDKKFLYTQLLNFDFTSLITGSGQPQIVRSAMETIKVTLPSIEEQREISIFFQQIDESITLQQRKCDSLITLKKSLLQKMFTKPNYNLPEMRFSKFTDSWEHLELGELGNTFTGLSGKTKEDFGHGNAKFITYKNVFGTSIADLLMTENVEIDKKQNSVKYGDIFFTTSSETPEEVGMSSIWLGNEENIYLNSFCFGFRPTMKIDEYYFAFMLRSPKVRKKFMLLAQGISRHNISKNKAMKIDVPVPNIEEQQKIGLFFKQLDDSITLNQC